MSDEVEFTPKELLANKLIDAWVTENKRPIPWDRAIKITSIVCEWSEETTDIMLSMK